MSHNLTPPKREWRTVEGCPPCRFQTRIFHSWLQANERRQRRSAGFQPAVSPTSSRLTVGKTEVVWNGRALRVGNPRYSRLAAVAPERRYGAPRRRKVCATAHAGLNYEISGLRRVRVEGGWEIFNGFLRSTVGPGGRDAALYVRQGCLTLRSVEGGGKASAVSCDLLLVRAAGMPPSTSGKDA